jgi:hypothetical protein
VAVVVESGEGVGAGVIEFVAGGEGEAVTVLDGVVGITSVLSVVGVADGGKGVGDSGSPGVVARGVSVGVSSGVGVTFGEGVAG